MLFKISSRILYNAFVSIWTLNTTIVKKLMTILFLSIGQAMSVCHLHFKTTTFDKKTSFQPTFVVPYTQLCLFSNDNLFCFESTIFGCLKSVGIKYKIDNFTKIYFVFYYWVKYKMSGRSKIFLIRKLQNMQ
jgi:hypothetical protein